MHLIARLEVLALRRPGPLGYSCVHVDEGERLLLVVPYSELELG